MVTAQKSIGNKTITKTFSSVAWSLLGNDKQGWIKVEGTTTNKVLTEPPTGDEKEVSTDDKGNLNQTVENKAVEKKEEPVVNKAMEAPKKVDEPETGNNPPDATKQPLVANALPGDEEKEIKLPYISKDYNTAKEAMAAMDTLTSKEQVQAFIKGEDRAKVLKHAQVFFGV